MNPNQAWVYPKEPAALPARWGVFRWPMEKILLCETAPPGMSFRSNLINVLGTSSSGKTHWLKHLFQKIAPQFDYGLLFSTTDRMSNEYLWIPKENRFNNWEDDDNGRIGFRNVLKKVMEFQSFYLATFGPKCTPHIFVIMDDPMGSVDFHNSIEFKTIAGQLRKFQITLFILHQYVKVISPAMRNGFHKLIVFQNNEDDLRFIKKLFLGFDSLGSWMAFASKATENYGAVIFNKENRMIYCVKAPKESADYRIKFNYLKYFTFAVLIHHQRCEGRTFFHN